MKILIVGGAGYVGGVVTDLLIKNKYNVTVYDSLLYEDQYMKDCPFVLGDVRDKERLKKAFEKIEKYECEGCKYNRPLKHDGKPAHNGKHVKIMDWEKGKVRRFVDLISK